MFKKITKIFGLFLVAGGMLAVASCGGNNTNQPSNPSGTNNTVPSNPVESSAPHVHSYKEEVIAPTCAAEGYTKHTCDCGDTYNDNTTAKLDHSFGAWYIATPATAEVNGLKKRVCSACGEAETEEYEYDNSGSALHNHVYGTWTVTQEPTVNAVGVLARSCSTGDDTQYFELPALGDSKYTKAATSVEATCTSVGHTDYVFTKDGQEFNFVLATQMLDHDCEVTTTAATCSTAGSTVKACKNCSFTETTPIKALGHNWNVEAATCTADKVCARCNVVGEAKVAHNYEAEQIAATCTKEGYTKYSCATCDSTYNDNYVKALGHDCSDEWTLANEKTNEQTCDVVLKYTNTCSVCEEEVIKEQTEYRHTYTASITTAATCQTDGVKTFTCSKCHDAKTEAIKDASAHVYGAGSEVDGITTYTCTVSGCLHTKTTISHKDQTAATVDKAALAQAGEIELKNASIALDQDTLAGLGDSVAIKAETVEKTAVPTLDDSKKDQIGDNPIYNFQMNNGQDTTFDGKVTIRVPYTLAEGENPDSIAIWYINADGSVQAIQAKYVNGEAVFETTHFSYYTVVKLAPNERCELYGHIWLDDVHQATCLEAGYTVKLCAHCGKTETEAGEAALGHNYELQPGATEAGCLTDGAAAYKCSRCDAAYATFVPATGHSFVVDATKSVAATCSNPGKEVKTCEACELNVTIEIAKKNHIYDSTVTLPTCEARGYTEYDCRYCDEHYVSNYVEALGHDYIKTTTAATCTEAGYDSFACSRCNSAYSANEVAAHHTWDIPAATCGQAQKCLACGETGEDATGKHTMENGVCLVCGQGCEHEYNTTVYPATCAEKGYTLNECTKCHVQTKSEYVEALGHVGDYVCSECGELLVGEKFFANLIQSVSQVRGANLVIEKLHVDFRQVDVTLENVNMYLGIENGELVGYGKANYVAKEQEYGIQTATVEFVLKDMVFYGKMTYIDDKLAELPEVLPSELQIEYSVKTQYIIQDLGETLESNKMVSTYKQYLEMVKGILEVEEVVEFINGLKEVAASDDAKAFIYELLANVLEKATTLEKNGNQYVMSVDFEALLTAVDDLVDLSIKEFVEKYAGEDSYADLKELVLSLFDLKVSDLLEVLTVLDITPTEVIELVTKVVPDLTTEQIEAQLKQMFGYSDAAFETFLKSKKDMNLAEFVLYYVVSNMTQKVPHDLEQITAMLAEVKEQVTTAFAQYGDLNAFDLVFQMIYRMGESQLASIKAMVKQYTALIKSYLPGLKASMITDLNGNLYGFKLFTDLAIDINGDEKADITVEGTILVKGVATVALDDSLIEEFEQFSGVSVTPALAKKMGWTPIYDEDGTLTAYKVNERKERYIIRENYEDNTKVYQNHCYYSIVDPESITAYSAVLDCGNWIKVNLQYNYERHTVSYEEIVKMLNGREVVVEQTEPKVENDNYDGSIRVYVNSKTKEIKYISGYSYSLHNYVEEESNDTDECNKLFELHQTCTICGDERILYYTNEHKTVKTAQLAEGSTTCEDGVIITQTCTVCKNVINQYTSKYHYDIETKIELDSECGSYLLAYSCACGEASGVKDYIECRLQPRDIEQVEGKDLKLSVCIAENCNFAILVEEYSEANGCDYVEYHNIYYGYNLETKEYTYKCSYTKVSKMHTVEEFNNTTTEDGVRIVSYGRKCTACEVIIREDIEKYDETHNLPFEIVSITTDYNGVVTTITSKYEFLESGDSRIISEEHISVYPNYTQTRTRKYTYEGCKVTITITNPEGYEEVNYEFNHDYEVVKAATCSQPGRRVCRICGDESDSNPAGHRETRDEHGNVVCSLCGLVATGYGFDDYVILEDLTKGNEENYLVGMYFRIPVQFIVITLESENGTSVFDELKAVDGTILTINKAAVAKFAEEKGLTEYTVTVLVVDEKKMEYIIALTDNNEEIDDNNDEVDTRDVYVDVEQTEDPQTILVHYGSKYLIKAITLTVNGVVVHEVEVLDYKYFEELSTNTYLAYIEENNITEYTVEFNLYLNGADTYSYVIASSNEEVEEESSNEEKTPIIEEEKENAPAYA